MSAKRSGTTAKVQQNTRSAREVPEFWRTAALTAAVVAAINVIIWVIGDTSGVSFGVRTGGQTRVNVTEVLLTSGLAVLAGAAALRLVMRLGRGFTVWLVIVCVLGIASLISPIVAGQTMSTRVTLAVMHLVVLGGLIAGLRRFAD